MLNTGELQRGGWEIGWAQVVGKRHRLINNSPARTRDLRGMDLLSKSESQRVKRWMPYGGGI